MTFLPRVVKAEYGGGYRIQLTFNDQSNKLVDFERWFYGPVFEPLKDTAYFRRFFIDGGTVAWPNGADIAPETLYGAPATRPTPRSSARRRRPAATKKRASRGK